MSTSLVSPVVNAQAQSPTLVVPQFADGGGWTTHVALVNPGDTVLTGTIRFRTPDGNPAVINTSEGRIDTKNYFIPPRSSQLFRTFGSGEITISGSIRITPDGVSAPPIAQALLSYTSENVTVTEAEVPSAKGSAFRVFVESTVEDGLESGIAIANVSDVAPTAVVLGVTDLEGNRIPGVSNVTIPLKASGQVARFLREMFPSLPERFKGVLRVEGTSDISVAGLRTRVNGRGDFLISTTPATVEYESAPSVMFFPQVADGGSYITQFNLLSAKPGLPVTGTLEFLKPDGSGWDLKVH